AIAKATDQDVVAERTEVARGDRDAPGSVEIPAGESRSELSFQIEDIHEAARCVRIGPPHPPPLSPRGRGEGARVASVRIRDKDLAIDHRYVEGREAV